MKLTMTIILSFVGILSLVVLGLLTWSSNSKKTESISGFLPIESFSIRKNVECVLDELRLCSDKSFQNEIFLAPDENLKQPERIDISMIADPNSRIVVPVKSLRQLANALWLTQSSLRSYNSEIKANVLVSGYEEFNTKYNRLLSKQWLLSTERYKMGYDPNPDLNLRRVAYGLVEVDKGFLEDLKKSLDESERRIKSIPIHISPYITFDNGLRKQLSKVVGAETVGNALFTIRISDKKTNDISAEYFDLGDGEHVMGIRAQLTANQKKRGSKCSLLA